MQRCAAAAAVLLLASWRARYASSARSLDHPQALVHLLDLPVDRNIKRGVTALSAQYSSSRRVRTREASCNRQAKRALRLPVSAHLRWLYVRREGLDLGAVQTAATGCSKMMF